MAQSLPNARHLVLKPFVGNCNRANSPYSHCFCILGAQTHFIKQIRIKRARKLFMLRFPQPIAKEQNEMCAVSSVPKGSTKYMMK